MRTLVESLRRLWLKNTPIVSEEKLTSMVSEGKISEEEKTYIMTGKME